MTAINSSAPVNPTTLRCLSDVNARQLDEAVRSKLDHLRCVIGANGMGLQQIRSKHLIPDENNNLQTEGHDPQSRLMLHTEIKDGEQFKLAFRKAYLLTANKLFTDTVSFWSLVETLLKDKKAFDETSLAAIQAKVDELSESVFRRKEINTQIFCPPRNQMCYILPMRIPGPPPRRDHFQMKLSRDTDGSEEMIAQMKAGLVEWYKEIQKDTLALVVFGGDPAKNENAFIPSALKFERRGKTLTALVNGTLLGFDQKFIAVSESNERRSAKYAQIVESEKTAVNDILLKLQKLIDFNRQIAALPVPAVSAPTPALPAISYDAAMSVQKVKKGPKVTPAADDDDNFTEAVTLPSAPAMERPQVVLGDQDAYNTFRTVMGADKAPISWNDVVFALKKIGFEVTQTPGSNTWKFKWKTRAWLRDEKTIEELAEEFEPEETTVAATSMHFPHQGGLTARGKLDTGRLSSFKKLLEESGFDLNCVTMKEIK